MGIQSSSHQKIQSRLSSSFIISYTVCVHESSRDIHIHIQTRRVIICTHTCILARDMLYQMYTSRYTSSCTSACTRSRQTLSAGMTLRSTKLIGQKASTFFLTNSFILAYKSELRQDQQTELEVAQLKLTGSINCGRLERKYYRKLHLLFQSSVSDDGFLSVLPKTLVFVIYSLQTPHHPNATLSVPLF